MAARIVSSVGLRRGGGVGVFDWCMRRRWGAAHDPAAVGSRAMEFVGTGAGGGVLGDERLPRRRWLRRAISWWIAGNGCSDRGLAGPGLPSYMEWDDRACRLGS